MLSWIIFQTLEKVVDLVFCLDNITVDEVAFEKQSICPCEDTVRSDTTEFRS